MKYELTHQLLKLRTKSIVMHDRKNGYIKFSTIHRKSSSHDFIISITQYLKRDTTNDRSVKYGYY